MNLYIASVDLINGIYPVIMDAFLVIAILGGILVITSKNPIVSVLFLISLFLVISVNLIFTGVHFIGLSYLLVYVGAVSILFLFILMLINIRVSELLSYTGNSLPLALIFALVLFNIIPHNIESTAGLDVCFTTTYKWDGILVRSSEITSIGNVMYTTYSPWLILVGLILLLAMVGSIVITVKGDSGEKSENDVLSANTLNNERK